MDNQKISYSKDEIINRLEAYIGMNGVRTLYQADFVNYRGRVEGDKPYTEVIAEYLLEHIGLFSGDWTISRTQGYNVSSQHDQVSDNPDSNREEEQIPHAMKGKTYPYIGTILDFQIPLKKKQEDKAGKMDLLSYDKESKVARILELKKKDSKDTMLHCVLETYSYLKTVDHNILKDSYNLGDCELKASPLVYKGSEQEKEYLSLWGGGNLRKLMYQLDMVPFFIDKGTIVLPEPAVVLLP